MAKETLLDVMNVVAALLWSPESLACLLEAARAVVLERCGAILDAWTREEPEGAE
jgi:hypothetical protein